MKKSILLIMLLWVILSLTCGACLPLDANLQNHVITLSIADPGQIVQKITFR